MNFDFPLVSAIVASYNHAEFLEARIESLLNQDYPNLEIIVIDDCSTDDSLNVLSKFQGISRIKIISNVKNLGWIETSNKGAEIANGDFIIFANCDDACDKRQISTLVESLRSCSNSKVAFTSSYMINELGEIIGPDFESRDEDFQHYCYESTTIPSDLVRKFFLRACVIPNLSAALISRDEFQKVGGFEARYRVCADWDLFLKLSKSMDFNFVSMNLNYFRQHATTIRQIEGIHAINVEIIHLFNEVLSESHDNPEQSKLILKNLSQIVLAQLNPWTFKSILNFFKNTKQILINQPAILLYLLRAILVKTFAKFSNSKFVISVKGLT